MPHELEFASYDKSGEYFSDTSDKNTDIYTERQSQPVVIHPDTTPKTVNADPVIPDTEIQNPVSQDQQPEQPKPLTTAPSPRRSMRSTAGKTSRYDDFVETIMNIANILCRELPHHNSYHTGMVTGGGREVVDIDNSQYFHVT